MRKNRYDLFQTGVKIVYEVYISLYYLIKLHRYMICYIRYDNEKND